MGTHILEVVTSSDALLLGRKTYDIFAGYWPAATDPVGAHLNSVTKYVASRRAITADWANTTVLDGDIPEVVATLKEQHELVSVTGSGDLIHTLLRHDLVDLFTFWVFPVILGSGKRLFDHGAIPAGLHVVDSWDVDHRCHDHELRAGRRHPLRQARRLDGSERASYRCTRSADFEPRAKRSGARFRRARCRLNRLSVTNTERKATGGSCLVGCSAPRRKPTRHDLSANN